MHGPKQAGAWVNLNIKIVRSKKVPQKKARVNLLTHDIYLLLIIYSIKTILTIILLANHHRLDVSMLSKLHY
jgi:hypothetical protein